MVLWLRRQRLQLLAKERITMAMAEGCLICQEYHARRALPGNLLHTDAMTASRDAKETEEEEELAGKLEHMLLVIMMISSQLMVRASRMEATRAGS